MTVLTQNTSDINSGRAFQQLIASFDGWEAVRDAPVEEIAQTIKSAGLSNIKARRIKDILRSIYERNGSLSLDFLRSLDVVEAKSWLRSLGGVGPKTVACVLLFSLGKPVLPVDTHVFRVSQRTGLVQPKVSVEAAHEYIEGLLQPEQVYAFHINVIAHGRRVCKAQRPKCDGCVLHPVCDNPVALPRRDAARQ
ncbi:MAG: endonuclease III [Chloroflexi bacterium]|nr:endonuclease III [Chloroflexota bacterium]